VDDKTNNRSSSRVGAVLVTYNPDDDAIQNIARLAEQVDQLVVVDNGSSDAFWVRLAAQQPQARFRRITNPENLGIATAFNLGARALLEAGCDFVMTFDQDSRIADDYVSQMLETFRNAQRELGNVAVLAPRWRDPQSGRLFSEGVDGLEVLEVRDVISSGCLIAAHAFSQVGFFADDYFIDGVDIEFCLRCRQHGLKIVLAVNREISHSLGQQMELKVLGASVVIFMHSHIRKYYMARNRIANYRKYAAREHNWFWSDVLMFIREVFHIILYENDKGRKLCFTLLGVWDGFRGKMGRIEHV
jgi:rhamnosyltransferase